MGGLPLSLKISAVQGLGPKLWEVHPPDHGTVFKQGRLIFKFLPQEAHLAER